MRHFSRRDMILGMAGAGGALTLGFPALADQPKEYSSDDIIGNGHKFFGSISKGLAEVVQEAGRRWGLPNGYVLGQEASGAFIAGLRYGEGTLYTRNAGEKKVYWQGPSIGFDAGADGDRTMMLVYNLPSVEGLFNRFGGINGSAYFVGGFGFTALSDGHITVVPIRSGIGGRLGVNVNYLKFTPQATWNPF